jgi:type IX secretion system PorP/SprF family membrane protein
MKQLFFTFIIALIGSAAWAQSDVQYTHFLFNKLAYNPAYAGQGGAPIITALYRNQWLNLEGAPTTATLNFHSPLANKRVGIGLSITADKVGMLNTNTVAANYSYRVPLGEGTLSLGVNARLQQGKVDWTAASPLDLGDSSIPVADEASKINPNFGFGFYYEQNNFYLGFSLPQLMNNSLYRDLNVNELEDNQSTYYLMGGFLADLSKSVKFQPGVLVSMNSATPFELDLNANLIFMDALWLGANYRLGDSFSALLQYQFTPQLRAGAAFDFTMTELKSYTNGSIEVLLSYTINKKTTSVEQVNHLRFF